MSGFWTKTLDGHTIHINGDPKMSEKTRLALCELMDAAAKQYGACLHANIDRIHIANHGPHYTFVVQRCQQCGETTVQVQARDSEPPMVLTTLRTTIAPYASNKPSAGYAYYWHFQGLNHSTPPIAPAPVEAA